ncbi:hypothetical protein MB46_02605 [Arthrobacter alpinus]|nr:hypothetical protein MB46_02605 [Arthrobacter alpinus]
MRRGNIPVELVLSWTKPQSMLTFPFDEYLDGWCDFTAHLLIDVIRVAVGIHNVVVLGIVTAHAASPECEGDYAGPSFRYVCASWSLNIRQDSGQFAERKGLPQQGRAKLNYAASVGPC